MNIPKMNAPKKNQVLFTVVILITMGVILHGANVLMSTVESVDANVAVTPSIDSTGMVIVGNKVIDSDSVYMKYVKDKQDQPGEFETIKAFIMHKNYRVYAEEADMIATAFMEAGRKYGFSPVLLVALSYVESSFITDAKSDKDAIGIMQINRRVWIDTESETNLITAGIMEDPQDLYNPRKNIMGGAYILKQYCDEGTQKGELNNLKYGLTKYYGGTNNPHYEKVSRVLGEYYFFHLLRG